MNNIFGWARRNDMPILAPWKGPDVWRLLEDWTITTMVNGIETKVTIPAGYFTDLESVPRIPFIYSLLKGHGRAAGCGHDYLYGYFIGTRKEADVWFLERCLRDIRVYDKNEIFASPLMRFRAWRRHVWAKFSIYAMYYTLRLTGWYAYHFWPKLIEKRRRKVEEKRAKLNNNS